MTQKLKNKFKRPKSEDPTGGKTTGAGIDIKWQNGTRGVGEDRKPLNGAEVEGVIKAAIDRLEFFQQSRSWCAENSYAIYYLSRAKRELRNRTKSRQKLGIEGKMVPNPALFGAANG